MKFSTYTPTIKPNTINARVSANAIKEAFGTDGSQLGALSSAASHIAGIIQKRQDEDDASMNSWANRQGWGSNTIESKKMTFRTQAVSGIVKACIADDKFDEADAWLKRERKNMNQDEFNSLFVAVEKQKKARERTDAARGLLGKYYNPATNELDVAGIESEARAMCTKSNGLSTDSIEAGYQKLAGQTMPDGTNGCVGR